MQIFQTTLILTLTLSPLALHGQASAAPEQPQAAGQSPAPSQAPAGAGPVTASSLVQTSLTLVQTTLSGLKVDKWKKGSVRDEAANNVKDVLQDLQTNVPPLLSASDAAPGALSKAIPLMKHLDALYDVVLRIEEGARVSAPSEQIESLQLTLKNFGGARIDFYNYLAQSATAQEKQVGDLQATLKTQQAAAQETKPAPAPAPCAPPKPAVKKKRAAPAKTPPGTTPPAIVTPPAPKTP
jgi:hypothetical protein